MKNVFKNSWFKAAITGIMGILIGVGAGHLSKEDASTVYLANYKIERDTAQKRVFNYGEWAGRISSETLKKAIRYQNGVRVDSISPDSFISYWTIDRAKIEALLNEQPDQNTIYAFLSSKNLVTLSDTTPQGLLENIGTSMKHTDLILTMNPNDPEKSSYYNLIQPCPTMCDAAHCLLDSAYLKGFKKGYNYK